MSPMYHQNANLSPKFPDSILFQIVTEIERQLQKEYGTGQDIKQQEEDELSKLLSNLGSKNTEETENKKIIGMDQDGTLILPEEPPKQKPLSKVKCPKFASKCL